MTTFGATISYLSIAILLGLLRYIEAVGPWVLLFWFLASVPFAVIIGSAMKRAGR